MGASINDIAKRAGVSKTTVSHAISGKRPVAAGTRERIKRAIDELGYVPNSVAQSLSTGWRGALGLVFPAREHSVSLDTTAELVLSVAHHINEAGFDFLLSTRSGLSAVSKMVLGSKVDGLLLMDIQLHDERVEYLEQSGFPFVAVGRTANMAGVPFVDVDGEELAFLATKHLLDLGHMRIGFIGMAPWEFGFTYREHLGYRRALLAADLDYDKHLAMCSQADLEAVIKVTTQLVSQETIEPATALVIGSDVLVPGVLQAIQTVGKSVPGDISIVAVGTSNLARVLFPPITVAEMRPDEMSRIAVQLLLERVHGNQESVSQAILPARLVINQSTAPLR